MTYHPCLDIIGYQVPSNWVASVGLWRAREVRGTADRRYVLMNSQLALFHGYVFSPRFHCGYSASQSRLQSCGSSTRGFVSILKTFLSALGHLHGSIARLYRVTVLGFTVSRCGCHSPSPARCCGTFLSDYSRAHLMSVRFTKGGTTRACSVSRAKRSSHAADTFPEPTVAEH